MYNNLIAKGINHFGPEGVILYSKSCDYYNINKIKPDDIKMFYELLISDEFPNNYNINKKTLISCCLYYLAKEDEKYKEEFLNEVIKKISRNDPSNDTNLILIYNIIEYDKKYLKSNKEKTKYLLEYLEKFSGHKKTVENFLLYKYYRGLLKFHLDQTSDAYKEYLEIITAIFDYVREETKYIKFIKLQNDLLKVQMDISKHVVNEYYEQYCFMKELFDNVKNENALLGIKLGFCLYELLCRQNKFSECIPLLQQMKKILNDRIFSGYNLKTSIDYSLAILSRLAFIGTLIGDKETVLDARKKLIKVLETIENDKDNVKLVCIFDAYNFCVSILNITLGIYENKLSEKALTFRKKIILEDNRSSSSKIDYILNAENRDYVVINLNSINNMDIFLNNFENKIMLSLENTIRKNIQLPSNQFLTFLVSTHNRISRLSESYCTDVNTEKRKDYIKNINELHSKVYSYVGNLIMRKSDEPLLECDFVKSMLIDIQQACVSANFGGKNIEKVKNLIIQFDKLKVELKINEKVSSYELINKIKGDYWFKTGDYLSAISYYTKTVEMMKNSDPKKPVVYFNLGCACYFYKKYQKAIENLNLCINAYRVFEYEQKTYDVLTRRDVILKKVKSIKRLIGLVENQKLKN